MFFGVWWLRITGVTGVCGVEVWNSGLKVVLPWTIFGVVFRAFVFASLLASPNLKA